mgnify:CR=1 FL=1
MSFEIGLASRPDSSRCLFHTYLESKVPLKCINKCIYNPVLFPDKRGRWHQSVFHQVLAEIPLVSFCKVFTNKRDLLFFIHFILRGIPYACFPSKHFLSGVVYNVQILIFMLQPLYWHFACLQHISNELLYIIAGALSMFPARGCVPNILPRECTGNTLPREVFLCKLPGAQWISGNTHI